MSIKHRISIGTITNGEWKFDHYATDYELTSLKPHTDGKVYMRSVTNKWEMSGFIYDSPYCSTMSLFPGWQDVSDTHRIEWGMETNDKYGNPLDIYDGDIFVDWNTGADGVSTRPIIFELLTCASCVSYDEFPMIEILGNIHENPEVLETVK